MLPTFRTLSAGTPQGQLVRPLFFGYFLWRGKESDELPGSPGEGIDGKKQISKATSNIAKKEVGRQPHNLIAASHKKPLANPAQLLHNHFRQVSSLKST